MPRTISPAQYRAELREFVEANVAPRAPALERADEQPGDLVRKLGAEGFYDPCVPDPKQVGPGHLPVNLEFLRVLVEELARARCFGLTLTVSMHVGVFLPTVARLGTDAVRDTVLTRGRRGELLGTVAATEADVAGSDFAGMATEIDVEDDRVVVDGHKHWITSGAAADHVVVFGRSRPGRHPASFSAVLVPTEHEGVRQEPTRMAVMRANAIGRLEFQRVEIGRDYLLGRPGRGFRYFLDHIAVERLTGAAWAVAVAEDCLAETYRYARAHSIGDATLWDRGAIRHRVARAAVRLALLRALTDRAFATTQQAGHVDQVGTAALKVAVPEAMEDVIGLCLQLRGARGLVADSPLLQLLNDFRVWGVAGGSTETMLDVVAEAWAERATLADDTSTPTRPGTAGSEAGSDAGLQQTNKDIAQQEVAP